MRSDVAGRLAKRLILAVTPVCLFLGCGSGVVNSDFLNKGDKSANEQNPFFASDTMTRLLDDNSLLAVDPMIGRIEAFRLDPFRVVTSWNSPIDDDHQMALAGPALAYAVVAGRSHYAVVGPGGTLVDDTLVPLEGGLRLIAFDSTSGVLVVGDNRQNLALLMLNAQGGLLRGKTLGPVVTGKTMGAATVLPDGRLVVASGADTLSVIDVGVSIADQAWKVTSTFAVTSGAESARSLSWMVPVAAQSGVVLIGDADRLLLVNVDTGTVLKSKDLSGYACLGTFASRAPHLVARTEGQRLAGLVEVFSAESGDIISRVVSWTGDNVTGSMMDVAGGYLALAGSPFADRENRDLFGYQTRDVSWIRLSDSATMVSRRLDGRMALGLTPGCLVSRYPSPLGFARRETWSNDPSVHEIMGFNLKYLR